MNASFELESYTYADYILSLSYPITRYNKSTRFGLFQPTSRSYDWSLLASCRYFNLPYFQPA